MAHFKMLPTALAAALVLAAGGTAHADSGEDEDGKEVAAVLGANTSITQALAAAEQKTGGRAFKIDVDDDNGAYLYEVGVISQDRISNVYVDMDSGQVIRTEGEGFLTRLLDGGDQPGLAELMASPTSLAAAIATAEQQTGGNAVEASFDDESGANRLEVAIAANDLVRQVMIDGTTGEILKIADADSDGNDDE